MFAYLNQIGKGVANWLPVNNGHPIITGIGSGEDMFFADLDGDGKADCLTVDPVSGAVTYYQNAGANTALPNGWDWIHRGQVGSGLGEAASVRFADMDGDGESSHFLI